jgi:N utilization substance protein A
MVKNVVRIPVKKKVAVETYDDRIDPVGACGYEGSRIHGIVRELGNENRCY